MSSVSYFQSRSHKVIHTFMRGCRGRDRMVVRFTTTYAISSYHH